MNQDEQKTSAIAIAALVFGILCLISPWFLSLPFSILAIILSRIAIKKISLNINLKGKKIAKAAFVLGVIGLLLFLITILLGFGLSGLHDLLGSQLS